MPRGCGLMMNGRLVGGRDGARSAAMAPEAVARTSASESTIFELVNMAVSPYVGREFARGAVQK